MKSRCKRKISLTLTRPMDKGRINKLLAGNKAKNSYLKNCPTEGQSPGR